MGEYVTTIRSVIGSVLVAVLVLVPGDAWAEDVRAAPTGVQTQVVLSAYSPLSRSETLARRLLSPLNQARVFALQSAGGKAMRDQPINLAEERFAIYVPAAPSPLTQTYGLMVYISPFPQAEVPPRWIPTLDQHHLILITAANSGNDTDVLNRRIPLALLAAQNMIERYPIDPDHVFIAGLSGGSRVALRIALSYADLFHGALLNAGSDPIGDEQITLPTDKIMRQFQARSRIVYVTGDQDESHLQMDGHSRKSLREWCANNLETVTMPHAGHQLADAPAFRRGVEMLIEKVHTDAMQLDACRARIDKDIADRLRDAESLVAKGDKDAARRLVAKIDAQYGGLAAPRSIELARQVQ